VAGDWWLVLPGKWYSHSIKKARGSRAFLLDQKPAQGFFCLGLDLAVVVGGAITEFGFEIPSVDFSS